MKKKEMVKRYFFIDFMGAIYAWTDLKKRAKAFHELRPSLRKEILYLSQEDAETFSIMYHNSQIIFQGIETTTHELNSIYASYYADLVGIMEVDLEECRVSMSSLRYLRSSYKGIDTLLQKVSLFHSYVDEFSVNLEDIDYIQMVRTYCKEVRETTR